MEQLLEDTLIRLRAPEPADVDRMFIWENDSALWPYGSATAPLSHKCLSDYVAAYDGDIFSARQLRLVIELAEEGRAVGLLDITDFDPRDRHARIGIFVEPSQRRHGIALHALELAKRYARECPGIHSLQALVAADNEPSRRLFAAAGFNTCGRVRSFIRRGQSYCDIIIYQTLL